MAYKVLGEAKHTLFISHDLKRTLAGRCFVVCIFESLYPKHNSNFVSARLVDTFNLVCATYTTYYLAITNFGDYSAFVYLPWYVTYHYRLLKDWRFLWLF